MDQGLVTACVSRSASAGGVTGGQPGGVPRAVGAQWGQEPAPRGCGVAEKLLQMLTCLSLALLQKDKRTPSCRTSQ